MNVGAAPGLAIDRQTERALQSGKPVADGQLADYVAAMAQLQEPGSAAWRQMVEDTAARAKDPEAGLAITNAAAEDYIARVNAGQADSGDLAAVYRMLRDALDRAKQSGQGRQGAEETGQAGAAAAGQTGEQSARPLPVQRGAAEQGAAPDRMSEQAARLLEQAEPGELDERAAAEWDQAEDQELWDRVEQERAERPQDEELDERAAAEWEQAEDQELWPVAGQEKPLPLPTQRAAQSQRAQDTAPVLERQAARPLPIVGQETGQGQTLATTEQEQRQEESGGAVKVGRNTTIRKPYKGPTPQTAPNAQYETVTVGQDAVRIAREAMGQAEKGEGGFKKSLQEKMVNAFKTLFNGRQVNVQNLNMDGRPYSVTLYSNAIKKLVSDPNPSVEKFAVIGAIEDIVKNAEYLGSGEYEPHSSHTKPVIRYDYFETQADIDTGEGAKPYTVSFDVEVTNANNRYRTHKIIKNVELHPAARGFAFKQRLDSTSTNSTIVSIPQSGENATPLPVAAAQAGEQGAGQQTARPLPIVGQEAGQGQGQEQESQAAGSPGGLPLPEQRAKSAEYQRRAVNQFVREVANTLSTPASVQREALKPAAQELAAQLRQTGKVDPETANRVFAKMYEQGRILLEEESGLYDAIRKQLRETPITLAPELRDSGQYKDLVRRSFGRLRIVNQGGTPVDVLYTELSGSYPGVFPADIINSNDQLEKLAEVARTVTRVEAGLDSYYADDPMWRQAARDSFDRSVERLADNMGIVRRYDAAQAADTGAAGSAPPTIEQMQAAYNTAAKLAKAVERAVQKNLLTPEDEGIVKALLAGQMTPEMVQGANRSGILEVYKAKKALQDCRAPVTQYRRSRRAKMRQTAAELLENSSKWTDKRSGLQYSMDTMERNMRDVAGEDAQAVIDQYFTPVHKHEAEATRWKEGLREQVGALKLNQQESEYLQIYGELEGVQAAREMGLARSDSELEALQLAEAEYLSRHKDKIDLEKVKKGLALLHQLYDSIFKEMNEVYVANGYAPMTYRQGYFPHIQENRPDGLLGKIANRLGFRIQGDGLPTDIAGLTYTFRPGRRWNPHAQAREGYHTLYDAVRGFDGYLEIAADVIYHTGDVQQLRALESQLREMYSDKGVREEARRIEEKEDLADDQKEALLRDLYKNSKGHLSNLAQQLNEYTNLLAGKKSLSDRVMEADLGRETYQLIGQLESRVAANMVAVNPGSWLTNFIPITQAAAECRVGSLLRGAKEAAMDLVRDSGFADRSAFLTNRRGSDPLYRRWDQRASAWLGKPMELIDNFTAGTIVRAKYYENLQAGMDAEMAMDGADAFAASIMADRSKGALPTVFNRKNPLTRLVTMYQVEVNNQLRYLFKDLPRAKRDEAVQALALALLKYFVGAYLYNDIYEHFIGRRPALDLIGIANEAMGDFTGYRLPNLLEPEEGFKVKPKRAAQAIETLGTNIAQELPFVGGLLGGGRLPISSAIPDVGKVGGAIGGLADGSVAPAKALDTLTREAAKPLAYLALPFGGGQLKKIAEGGMAVAQGGSYGLDNNGDRVLRFAIPDKSLGTWLQAIAFGPYALPTGRAYAAGGFKTRSAQWTREYEEAKAAGVDYNTFAGWKDQASQVRADRNERGNTVAGSKARNLKDLLLSIKGLTEEQRRLLLRQAGYDWDTLETVKEDEQR